MSNLRKRQHSQCAPCDLLYYTNTRRSVVVARKVLTEEQAFVNCNEVDRFGWNTARGRGSRWLELFEVVVLRKIGIVKKALVNFAQVEGPARL
mmetsp:Transcript_30251/g.97676  ORF Transcript_30251/g.97676 Transcript_30251/m.97676 type:complete len:93 (+) Transcript_30251:348-626(+)